MTGSIGLTGNLQPEGQHRIGVLTCQWCSVRLPTNTTLCPTCGSPGVPDLTMTVPGAEILESTPSEEPSKPKDELDEWWLDDQQNAVSAAKPMPNTELLEDRLLKTVGILAGAAVIFAIIGWLAGPLFLAPLMEDITGSPVESMNDLRPMGAILGLITGLFFGACIGWINQE